MRRLALHHDRHSFERQAALKQGHYHRRGDIIWEIGADIDGHPAEFFLYQGGEIGFQHIGVDYFYIIKISKSFIENGQQL